MRKIILSLFVLIFSLHIKVHAQNVGINITGNSPDASSMLDVDASDKGILIPRVSLLDVSNSTAPVNAPATGLLVYNTNASVTGGAGAGFYFWSGSAWTKMATGNFGTSLNDGRIWVGDGTNAPVERQMSGDVAIGNTGVTSIQPDAVTSDKILDGAILNADVNAAAAIDRSKLADGTANHVLINNGSGVMSSEANLSVSRGGTGRGTLTANNLLVGNGTSAVNLIAPGTSGNVLLSNGTSWVSDEGNGSFIKNQTGVQPSSNFNVSDNGTIGGALNFGSATRQMVNLYGTTYGIGIQSNTQYFRTNSNFAWFYRGVHSNTALDPGTGGTALMVLDGSGNLGIGTTAPTQTLHVEGNARITGDLLIANTVTITSGRLGRFANGTAAAPTYSFSGDTDLGMYRVGTNALGFSTAAAERMRISATGNVAIGTTTTGRRLQVTGPVGDNSNSPLYIEGTTPSATWNYVAEFMIPDLADNARSMIAIGKAHSSGNTAHIDYVHHATDANIRSLRIGFYGSANILNVTNSGNVGVGIDQPGFKFHVIGSNYGLASRQNTGTTTIQRAAIYTEASDNTVCLINARSATNTQYKIWGGGTVSTIVDDGSGNKVTLHAPETPEVYFMDYGQGRLVNGKAHIDIDPIFARNVTINDRHPLRVYIQLEGECNGVYVTNKTATGFDVVELNGGTSDVTFQWNIVCNRADDEAGDSPYEDLRFEPGPTVDKDKATTEGAVR